MAVDIYPAAGLDGERKIESRFWIKFDDDGYYYHLIPYFQSAKMPPKKMLIDLHTNSEISGYELNRLQCATARCNDGHSMASRKLACPYRLEWQTIQRGNGNSFSGQQASIDCNC